MSRDVPSPKTTLAILLGGREGPAFARSDSPWRSDAFANSANAVYEYLCAKTGWQLPNENVLPLFREDYQDSNPGQLIEKIREFFTERKQAFEIAGVTAQVVLVYFVGHGEFIKAGGINAVYHLYLPSTREKRSETALEMTKLLGALRQEMPHVFCIFVIDACFAGLAQQAFEISFPDAILDADEKQKTRVLPLKGIAMLCSSSSQEQSLTLAGEPYTMFSGTLLDVLRWGVPGDPPAAAFSISGLHAAVTDRLKHKYGAGAVLPQIGSTDAEAGGAADQPLFPNAAAQLTWCVILSESDQHDNPESLHQVATLFRSSYGGAVQKARELPLAPNWWELHAAELVESPARFYDAVSAVCRCELAFFDLTNYEPAVTLLLGIRAVARRGVTVCSVGGKHAEIFTADGPFHFKDINILQHAPVKSGDRNISARSSEAPEDLFGNRVVTGFRELRQAPQRYLDLPCFDAVRQLASAGCEPNRSYHEQVLMLCSFDEGYVKANWHTIRRHLKAAIKRVRDDNNVQSDREPSLVRTLDMHSPRLVSEALLETILRTEFCVIDWTKWRPSVFFELGVRLSVSEHDPICIIEASARTAAIAGLPAGEGPAELSLEVAKVLAEQCTRLLKLFAPLDYSCAPAATDPTSSFRAMVLRHLQQHPTRSALASTEPVVPNTLPPRFTYRAVWNLVDPRSEPVADPVEHFLRQNAEPLLITQEGGSVPFVYPKIHSLKDMTEATGRERLLAAWLYLHHRVGPIRLRADKERAYVYKKLGWDVVPLLKDAADEKLAEWITARLLEFDAAVQET